MRLCACSGCVPFPSCPLARATLYTHSLVLEKKKYRVLATEHNTAAGGGQRRSGAEAELERIAARRQLFWWLVRAAPASRQFAVASLEELRAVRKSAARPAAASMPHGPWNQLQSR